MSAPQGAPVLAPAALLARTDITASAKLAWLGLTMFLGKDGLSHPRLVDLQQVLGMPDRTLRRALSELVETGTVTPLRMSSDAVAYIVSGEELSTGTGQIGRQNGRTDLTKEYIYNTSTLQGEERGAGERRTIGRQRRVPTLIPADWLPSKDALAYAAEHAPHADASRELVKFVAYWRERRVMRADWNLSFMRWLDKAQPSVVAAPVPGAGGAAGGSRPMSGGMAFLLRTINEENRDD